MHTQGVLMGKPEGKRLLGRTRRRREDNIKVYPKVIGRGVNWFFVAEDREK